uniref:Putative effector protein n=1 Tax=Heterodera avenae TaxID=34510 RepID=A0A2L0VDQ0_HETAV|nr:putative effector protein [Heterodera avenae]
MSSFSSPSLLSVIAIVCLLCKLCISAPHPCCPGSQHIVSLMSPHSAAFSASMPKASLCSNAQNIAKALDGQLKSIAGCPSGGGNALVAQINASLPPTDDQCSHSLGFVRALFGVAASAASHAGNNSKWSDLAAKFKHQIQVIDEICDNLRISIGQVEFNSPKAGNHAQVPITGNVIGSPALSGSHRPL